MNKAIKYLLSVAVGLATLTSCETYGDPQYEESSIGVVMSGYWTGGLVEDITNPDSPVVLATGANLTTYSTSDAVKDKMWIWYNSATFGIRGKVGIDLAKYEILPTQGVSTLPLKVNPADVNEVGKNYEFAVLSGNVKVNGYTTLTGGKSDLLTVVYTSEAPAAKGKTIRITAWRETQWEADHE